MKGPYERLKYDLRRLWECPRCQRRERSEGSVTYLLCQCEVKSGGQPVPMKLLEEAGHRTVPPIVPMNPGTFGRTARNSASSAAGFAPRQYA